MVQYFHSEQFGFRRQYTGFLLGILWLTGLITGVIVQSIVRPFHFSLMRGIFQSSMSFVGLICGTCFPFLFSAFAVYIGQRWLLHPLCFGRVFLFSFVSSGLWSQFGSSGWLAWLLIMFSDLITLPLLYGYCMRHVSGFRAFSVPEVLFLASVFVLMGCFDYCCLSPFLAMLSF